MQVTTCRYELLTQTSSEEFRRPLGEVLREVIKAEDFFSSFVKVAGQQRKLLAYNARKDRKKGGHKANKSLAERSATAFVDFIKGKCYGKDDAVNPGLAGGMGGTDEWEQGPLPDDPVLLRTELSKLGE